MSDKINFNEQQILKEQPQQNTKKQKKTKYHGVYVDNNGKFFYQTEFGLDKITAKRGEKIKTELILNQLVKLTKN